MFKYINDCKDSQYLFDGLTYDKLVLVELVLNAYNSNKIDIIIPRFEDGELNIDGNFEIEILDSSYEPNGLELLILKWYESYEDTGYLLDCLS